MGRVAFLTMAITGSLARSVSAQMAEIPVMDPIHSGHVSPEDLTRGYRQFARPFPPYVLPYRETPYPKGPCCTTIFGELICDIKDHAGCFIRGEYFGNDIPCDGYVDHLGYCEDSANYAPRLRDLLLPSFSCGSCSGLGALFRPLGGYQSCTGLEGDVMMMGEELGEAVESPEAVPLPPPPIADEDSTVSHSSDTRRATRLRSLILPPGLPKLVSAPENARPVDPAVPGALRVPSKTSKIPSPRHPTGRQTMATAQGNNHALRRPGDYPAAKRPRGGIELTVKSETAAGSPRPNSTVERHSIHFGEQFTFPAQAGFEFGKGARSRFRQFQ